MKRTQLYIDQETYRLATVHAKMRGITISELVRQGLRTQIKQTLKENSLKKLVLFAEKFPDLPGTPTDMSTNLDHYLYGTPKRRARP